MKPFVHCWADKGSTLEWGSEEWAEVLVEGGATCMREHGHEGDHEWVPDKDIEIIVRPGEEA